MTGSETVRAVEIFVILLGAASLVAVATRRLTALPYSVALVILGTAGTMLLAPLLAPLLDRHPQSPVERRPAR